MLIVVAAVLFAVDLSLEGNTRTFTVNDVKSMPAVSGSYRSINRWKTVQTFTVKGVPFYKLLAKAGVTDGKATLTVIAPDGYFWPGPKDKLTVTELKRRNSEGLMPVVAYQMDGGSLDPEPDGTGPLRYVAPQYSPDEENKPSWVSNARVIQVGPVAKGLKAPEAKKVPTDEIRVFGNIPDVYPFSIIIPVTLAAAGLAALIVGLLVIFRKRSKGKAGNLVALVLVSALVVGAVLGLGSPRPCKAAQSVTFSSSDLESMPATSAHYTFLKQLPPYTYYEADYTGVQLSYLLEQKLNLDPVVSGVVVKCSDGYTVNLSLAQVNNTYAGGLRIIVAYAKGGAALVGDEGPLRLIVPQTKPGNHDQGGDANTPLCARMVNAIEVTPAAGVVAPGSLPSGSLAVYGSVTSPPLLQDSPTPQSQPQPQAQATTPAQTNPTVAVQQQKGDALMQAVNRSFSDSRHMVSWLMGSAFACALPGSPGKALLLLYYVCGI